MKTISEVRTMFLDFMKSNGHKEAPNASLVPLNDPTVLFTTAGMHPLVPYLLGQPHPLGTRLTNSQRCVRTNDIDEVGDATHLTFFEMLGYWSLGDYFKEEALKMSFEFYTSEKYIGFDPKRMYVTVFEGDKDAAQDELSIQTWKNLFSAKGIEAEVWNTKDFNQNNLRIFPLNKKENWWGPAGETGPCGPDSEMFYWTGVGEPDFTKFVPWDDSGMFIEVGNDVFMEFNKTKDGNFEPLAKKNVDFGGGLERITILHNFRNEDGTLQKGKSVYDTDIFQDLIKKVEEISGKRYDPAGGDKEVTKSFRVIVEHSRSATFMLADGVKPSSKEQGYVLRRLIRRMIRYGAKLGITQDFTKDLGMAVIQKMSDAYPHLTENQNVIIDEIDKEEIKFRRTLDIGLKYVETQNLASLDGKIAFNIYETYGFPLEMTLDELGIEGKMAEKIVNEFKEEEMKHKEASRAGAEQKFKGGLADQSEQTTRLHTAHHLLLKALQQIVSPDIHQKGSNITPERLRIDFNYSEKLTDEQVKQVEDLVNNKIKEGLEVKRIEMPKEKAMNIGAEMEFGQKYPDVVSVYVIGNDVETQDLASLETHKYFSAEFCGGPHVSNTREIGEGGKQFKIQKQENVGAGVRRIKANLV